MTTKTTEERRAELEAELRALDTQSQAEAVEQASRDVTLADVVHHLVHHSGGYPTVADREVHAKAVRRHFGTGEYAPDTDKTGDAPAEGAEQ